MRTETLERRPGGSAAYCSAVVLLSLLIVLPVAESKTINLCFLYPDRIRDAGYTFMVNVGRRELWTRLGNFPQHNFMSHYVESFPLIADKATELHRLLDDQKCHIIFSTSSTNFLPPNHTMLLLFAETYPDRWFVELSPAPNSASVPNHVYLPIEVMLTFYEVGFIVGAQSQSCVAFLASYANNPAVLSILPMIANSVYLGMNHSGSSATLVYAHAKEDNMERAASLMVDHGCDVLVPYSFGTAVNQVAKRRRIMSVSLPLDLSVSIGDSILTSIVGNLTTHVYRIIVLYMSGLSLPQDRNGTYTLTAGTLKTTPVSPNARRAAFDAAVWAHNRTQALGYAVLCDPWVKNFTDGRCPTVHDVDEMIFPLLPGIKDFSEIQAPSACPAGTSYSYDTADRVRLVCSPCGKGTYSSEPGWAECKACSALSGPTGDSAQCTPHFWVFVLFPALVVVALIVGIVLCVQKWSGKVIDAPMGPFVGLGLLAVDRARAPTAARPASTSHHVFRDAVMMAADSHGVYVSIMSVEICFVVARSSVELIQFARSVKAELGKHCAHLASAVTCAINYGVPRMDFRRRPVRYYGPEVDFLHRMYEKVPRCGIWCTFRSTKLEVPGDALMSELVPIVMVDGADGAMFPLASDTPPGSPVTVAAGGCATAPASVSPSDAAEQVAPSTPSDDIEDELARLMHSELTPEEFEIAQAFIMRVIPKFLAILPHNAVRRSLSLVRERLKIGGGETLTDESLGELALHVAAHIPEGKLLQLMKMFAHIREQRAVRDKEYVD